MTKNQLAILRTLAYADVFDYPLKFKELQFYLIGQKTDARSLKKSLCGLNRVSFKKKYFFLKNKEKNIYRREKREKASAKKWLLAQKTVFWLKFIPWVKMVAVTGGLAMRNSQAQDDIDLLIVSSENRLWLTRFLSILITEVLGLRRRPRQKTVADKICLNMFLDENHLAIPLKEQNLFTAHEICQLKPLWFKDKLYQRFIKANLWSQKFLPNWKP